MDPTAASTSHEQTGVEKRGQFLIIQQRAVLKPGPSTSTIPGTMVTVLRMPPGSNGLHTIACVDHNAASGFGQVNNHCGYAGAQERRKLSAKLPSTSRTSGRSNDVVELSSEDETESSTKSGSSLFGLQTPICRLASLVDQSPRQLSETEQLLRRQIINRDHAQKSRERKQKALQNSQHGALILEATVARLTAQRDNLRVDVEKMKTEFRQHKEAGCILPKVT